MQTLAGKTGSRRPVTGARARATAVDRSAPDVVRNVVLAGVATLAVAIAIRQVLALEIGFLWAVLALVSIGGAAVAVLAVKHQVATPFGAANRVTLARGALAVLLFALLAAIGNDTAAWVAAAAATLGLALDGVDGRLARGRGEESAFGARFDMETDALLILGLATLVWQFDKAGVWILLAGLLQYAFVAAGYALEWLRRPLPRSRRRQTICVVQIVALVAAMLPPITPALASAIAAAGLSLNLVSFAIDTTWLARRARG